MGSLGPGLLRSDTSPTNSNEICRYFMFVVNFQNAIVLPFSVDGWLSGSGDSLLICWLLGLLDEDSSGSPRITGESGDAGVRSAIRVYDF